MRTILYNQQSTQLYLEHERLDGVGIDFSVARVEILFQVLIAEFKYERELFFAVQHVVQSESNIGRTILRARAIRIDKIMQITFSNSHIQQRQTRARSQTSAHKS